MAKDLVDFLWGLDDILHGCSETATGHQEITQIQTAIRACIVCLEEGKTEKEIILKEIENLSLKVKILTSQTPPNPLPYQSQRPEL